MGAYGSFETDRELSSAQGARVYRARQTGVSAGDDFVVKVFSLESLIGPDQQTRSDLDPLLADLSQAFTRRIELQRQAAAVSKRIAPILETGRDERGAWYATRFYPRSVQRIIAGRVALSREALFHIVKSIVGGALEVKQACARGHGNLKPANVLIGAAAKLRDAEIALTDLLPGGDAEAARYEIADLRAIGEIIYQLVRRREIADSTNWLILPIEASKEWSDLFGKDAELWRGLCNRLLDPNLSTETYSLEKLAGELAALEPKPPVSRRALALAGGIVVLLAAAVFVIFPRLNRAEVRITSDPPGASLLVNGQPRGKTPLHEKLSKGNYDLVAQYGELEGQRATLVIDSRQGQSNHFQFDYGGVTVTSEPPGASVKVGGAEVGKTPFTTNYLKPGRVVEFQLDLDEHETANVNTTIKYGPTPLLLHAKLTKRGIDDVLVEFDYNLPRGEKVGLNGNSFSNLVVELPLKKSLPPGPHTVTAAYRNWPPVVTNVVVRKGDSQAGVRFEFRYGRVALKSDPPEATVSFSNILVGVTPTNVIWPPGPANFKFERPGYDPALTNAVVADSPEKDRVLVEAKLAPILGFVQITSDPAPAEIADANNKSLTLTTPDGPVVIQLPPNSYTLTASYRDGDLIPVQKTVTVEKGKTKQLHFPFVYGKVALTSDPPGAEVWDPRKQAWVSLDKISILRVGTHSLKAQLPSLGLDDVEDPVVVASGTVQAHTFKFKYGTVIITSIPPGAVVLENGTRKGQTPYSRIAKFGPVSYSLVLSNKIRPLSATISSRTNYYLSVDFTQPDTWPNSIGMKFAHIPKTADNPDGEYWVGVYEVTQEEYVQIMGPEKNQSNAKGKRLPVHNVTWPDATNFCAKLLALDAGQRSNLPAGMTHYTLPTESQWQHFVGDASWDDAVISSLIKREKPEEVGSTGKANNFGLYDVRGNVWEMCVRDVHQSAFVARGGGYETGLKQEPRFFPQRGESAEDKFTGFRVVLVPESK